MIQINLRNILKQKGITLTELHELTGISMKSLSIFQNQKRDGIQFDTLEKIARSLEFNISDLLEINDYNPESKETRFNKKIEKIEDDELFYEQLNKIALYPFPITTNIKKMSRQDIMRKIGGNDIIIGKERK